MLQRQPTRKTKLQFQYKKIYFYNKLRYRGACQRLYKEKNLKFFPLLEQGMESYILPPLQK